MFMFFSRKIAPYLMNSKCVEMAHSFTLFCEAGKESLMGGKSNKKKLENEHVRKKLNSARVISTLSQQVSESIAPSAILTFCELCPRATHSICSLFFNPCNWSSHYDSMCVSIENYIAGV